MKEEAPTESMSSASTAQSMVGCAACTLTSSAADRGAAQLRGSHRSHHGGRRRACRMEMKEGTATDTAATTRSLRHFHYGARVGVTRTKAAAPALQTYTCLFLHNGLSIHMCMYSCVPSHVHIFNCSLPHFNLTVYLGSSRSHSPAIIFVFVHLRDLGGFAARRHFSMAGMPLFAHVGRQTKKNAPDLQSSFPLKPPRRATSEF